VILDFSDAQGDSLAARGDYSMGLKIVVGWVSWRMTGANGGCGKLGLLARGR
jgi:hypothetical protein